MFTSVAVLCLCGYGRELSYIGIKEFANRKLCVKMPPRAITDALG